MVNAEYIFAEHVRARTHDVLFIHDALNRLQNPALLKILSSSGFQPAVFADLLKTNFTHFTINTFEINTQFSNKAGKVIESVPILSVVNVDKERHTIIEGNVEVSECFLFEAAGNAENPELSLHVTNHPKISEGGFEAIYIEDGEVEIAVAEDIPPGYKRGKVEKIVLKKGDLAIIKAGVANGWSRVKDGAQFRYICWPPWDERYVLPVD